MNLGVNASACSLGFPKGSHLLGSNEFLFLCTHFFVSFSASLSFCWKLLLLSLFKFLNPSSFVPYWLSQAFFADSPTILVPVLWIPAFSSSHPHNFSLASVCWKSFLTLLMSWSILSPPIVFFTSQMMTPPYFSLILGFLSHTSFGFCHILSSSFLYCFIAGRLFIDQLSLTFSTSM